jgi:hypothetical protein
MASMFNQIIIMNKTNTADLFVKYFKMLILAIVLVIPISFVVCLIGKTSTNFTGFARTYIYWKDYNGVIHISDDIFQFTGILYIAIILIDLLVKLVNWTLKNKS